MPIWKLDTGKKPTGAEVKLHRKKRKYDKGSLPFLTKIGKERRKIERRRGGTKKIRALSVEFANVFDPKAKKTKKVKILSVIENPANPELVRREVITKGAIIKTEIGEAKVTSRPSQHGVVNAILIERK